MKNTAAARREEVKLYLCIMSCSDYRVVQVNAWRVENDFGGFSGYVIRSQQGNGWSIHDIIVPDDSMGTLRIDIHIGIGRTKGEAIRPFLRHEKGDMILHHSRAHSCEQRMKKLEELIAEAEGEE